MVPIKFWAMLLRNEPAPGQRNSGDHRRVPLKAFFPARKIDGTGIWAQGHELREGHPGALSGGCRRVEGLRTIAGQSKNERSQNMHAVLTKSSEALDQV